MVLDLLHECRVAIRRLAARPGFALTAIGTLAIGLGANIAIFTLVHALLLKSLPVERPDELVRLGDKNNCCVNSGLQGSYSLFSTALFEHLRDATRGEFVELAGFQAANNAVGVRREGGAPGDSVRLQFATGNYFTMFGVRAAAGRLFQAADDAPAAPPVAVLSHDTWARRFGQDPAIVGSVLVVNGTPVTVIGVAARGFFGDSIRPNPTGLWVPVAHEPLMRGPASVKDKVGQDWLWAIGRLQPGADVTRVSVVATEALRQWLTAQSFVPDAKRPEIAQQRVALSPGGQGVGGMRAQFQQPLRLLLGTSALVLLVAAANLANLLLARADRGQAAVRAALGASAPRLVREAVLEGVILSLAGGVIGIALSTAGVRTLTSLVFPDSGAPIDLSPSLPILAFAVVLAFVTGVLFTALPALAMSRTAPAEALSGVGRSGGPRSFVPRRSLAVVQVSLSLLLLSAAQLLATSLGNLERQALGFDPVGRTVVYIDPPAWAGQVERLERLYERVRERLARVPGVTDVSYALYSPMEGNNWSSRISIAGRTVDPVRPPDSSWNRVGPRFFETTGTRLRRGRLLDATDGSRGRRVAVVNEAFARRYFPDSDPVGQALGIGNAAHAADVEIVGVVEDVKYAAPAEPVRTMIFLPAFQTVSYTDPNDAAAQSRSLLLRTLVLQTTPGVRDLEATVRTALAEVELDLTVVRVVPMPAQVAVNFRLQRLMARLTTFYGALALGLAALGLYGVTAYAAAQRTREIGVRMALGARAADVRRLVVAQTARPVAAGVALGVVLGAVAARLLAGFLYGISPSDPVTFAGVTALLLFCALGAAYLPARRASRIDPMTALRTE